MPADYFSRVPSDPVENVAWRIRMARAAHHDPHMQRCLKEAAFDDLRFFFQAFLWINEPRSLIKVIPFCLWPHQAPVFLEMDDAIARGESTGKRADLLCPKSRAQGGTFGFGGVFIRRWLRDRRAKFGLVTRNEDMVDSRTNEDTLMYKLVFMLKMLPFWMLPEAFDFEKHRSLSEHILWNPENEATIKGSAAVGDLFRGGRLTALGFDEIGSREWIVGGKDYEASAASLHATYCRLFVSTFGADSGMFYASCQDPGNTKVVKLDWRDNPLHSCTAFTVKDGKAVARDPKDQPAAESYVRENRLDIEKLVRRGFITDGKLVSPWYIDQCLATGSTPQSIAREVDMDARGAVGKIFNSEVLARMRAEKCRPPVWEGSPVVMDGGLRLNPQDNGPLKLWFRPGLGNEPPDSRFVVGADIATGQGGPMASNSVLIAGDTRNGEQVLEYVDSRISPTRLARLAVAICQWLRGAKLIWEATGPTGGRFKDEVKLLAYSDVWRSERDKAVGHDRIEKPGWANNHPSHKVNLFEDWWVAMDDDLFVPRSEEMISECGGWEWNGEKVVYSGNVGHGDRAIAGGLCWKAMKDLMQVGLDKKKVSPQTVKYGSFGWRREQAKARQEWDDTERGFGIQGTIYNDTGVDSFVGW